MKVRRRPRNDWGFQKQQFLSGQIESEATKVNLDWWNTCNAFPPFFIFSLFCEQGPGLWVVDTVHNTKTHPGWTVSAGSGLFDIFVSIETQLAGANRPVSRC